MRPAGGLVTSKEINMIKTFDRRQWLEQKFDDLNVGQLEERDQLTDDQLVNLIDDIKKLLDKYPDGVESSDFIDELEATVNYHLGDPTWDSLRDLTGNESGAVVFDKEAIICNWASIQGVPRLFVTGLIGLDEKLKSAVRIQPPEWVKDEMIKHDINNGGNDGGFDYSEGWRAWEVTTGSDEVFIVVTHVEWN
jgi:hypothetical protein